MIFIRKVQKATLNAPQLQNIERSEALSHGQSVIQIIVDDQVWRCPVFQMPRGIPLLVALPLRVARGNLQAARRCSHTDRDESLRHANTPGYIVCI